MASGRMRVPRTIGRPDTLPGIISISSQAIQSMSESVSTFAMFLPPFIVGLFNISVRRFRPRYVAAKKSTVACFIEVSRRQLQDGLRGVFFTGGEAVAVQF